MKCFKILSCVYRNRRKRLNLRFNLLAGIYNLDWVKDKQLNWLKMIYEGSLTYNKKLIF